MMRLGSIRFINSLPVDWGLLSGNIAHEAEVARATPAVLNDKILKGELDVSPVSAFWYAAHQKHFWILPHLSISSQSGVQSVLLFSRVPVRDLDGKKIAVTGKGRTTPALLEILCRQRYGIRPEIVTTPLGQDGFPKDLDAALLIGDEALVAKQKFEEAAFHITDLAEEWRAWTGLPIVFAVWAVRKEAARRDPEAVRKIQSALMESKAWGRSHREEVILEAARVTALPKIVLESYFSNLSYEFGDDLKKGMRLYFGKAAECGLLRPVEDLLTLESAAAR